MNNTISQVVDLQKYAAAGRKEENCAIGKVISGGGISIGAGRFKGHDGLGHVAVRFIDKGLHDGEPRYYLIPRAAALELATALQKAASEVDL